MADCRGKNAGSCNEVISGRIVCPDPATLAAAKTRARNEEWERAMKS